MPASPQLTVTRLHAISELDACATVLVAAYNGEPWNDAWTHHKALEKLECFYHSPKFYGWKAELEGEVVGCCVGNIEPYFTGDYFYLKEMFVSPQVQHAGIGSQLLATLQAKLTELDIQTIILFTSHEGFPWQFYIKHGFDEMDGMRMMHLDMRVQD
jgi:aminoglycoside 6'-N-acetyltransferase I